MYGPLSSKAYKHRTLTKNFYNVYIGVNIKRKKSGQVLNINSITLPDALSVAPSFKLNCSQFYNKLKKQCQIIFFQL